MATFVEPVPGKTRYSIEVVGKAFTVLQVFIDEKKETLSFTEIATRVGLNKNAVFRLLFTLIEQGYLRKTSEGSRYALSLKCMELGRAARLANDIRRVALPYMNKLWQEFEDTVNLAVLDDGQVCYLEVLESSHRFKLVASPGDHDPVHCTALGKAIMAHLPPEQVKQILESRGMPPMTASTITTVPHFQEELINIRRRQGFAINEGEMVEASRCVAVPVMNGKGRVIAALSLSGTAMRVTAERVPAISQSLLRCSAEISKQLD